MTDIIVIGGGAAGMMAALTAAQGGASVALLERNPKLGRKLYITGKGRCNVTNHCTVGELLQNPRARAVFQRRFGKWMKHPMVQAAHSLTLAQLSEMAAVYLPKKTIEETIQELKGV